MIYFYSLRVIHYLSELKLNAILVPGLKLTVLHKRCILQCFVRFWHYQNEAVLYTNILVICTSDVYILHCPILYATHSIDTGVLHFTGRESVVLNYRGTTWQYNIYSIYLKAILQVLIYKPLV